MVQQTTKINHDVSFEEGKKEGRKKLNKMIIFVRRVEIYNLSTAVSHFHFHLHGNFNLQRSHLFIISSITNIK
jgi:hypothetical protein